MLLAGEALAHAHEELSEGGAEHGGACAHRAADGAQQCPQVASQRLRTLLQQLGLGGWAVQSRAPATMERRCQHPHTRHDTTRHDQGLPGPRDKGSEGASKMQELVDGARPPTPGGISLGLTPHP